MQLDRVPQTRASVSPDAPRWGPVCRWRLPCGRRGSPDLAVPIHAGFAGGKPPVICPHIPPPMRLGIWGQFTGKPAPQRAKGSLRTGCLFPSGPSELGRGPPGKSRLTRSPMSGHGPGSAAARVWIVRVTSEGRAHGQLPPLREDDQTQRRALCHGGGNRVLVTS